MELKTEREAAEAARTSSTVLLVEDDEGDALLVRDGLSLAAPELELRRAETLAEALDTLPGECSCALLDLGLPDTVGLDAVRQIRERAPSVAVVVLTGRADEQLGIEALGAGAQDYLVKGEVDPEVIARAIRYAIERRRAELSEQELLEARFQARENARLERGLLPTALISDDRLHLTTDYRPGRVRGVLGGDFYDAVELDDGSVNLVIGDVSGHGVDEAALGASMRIAWRALTLAGHPPEEVLATLHAMLPHESHAPNVFATLCTLAIAPDRCTATVRLAGHHAPIVIDASGARRLDVPDGAPPLGILEQSSWPGVRAELGSSWSILLYTDGLVEGKVDGGPERLGEERLVEMVERHARAVGHWHDDARDLLGRLIGEAERLNGEPLTDDVAVMLLSVAGD
ncbi:MAG: SpoIIE family protein phosphatase [Thermoleophilaceae bacterium]